MGNAGSACSCNSDTSATCIHEEEARERRALWMDSDEEDEEECDDDHQWPWPSKRSRRSTKPPETYKPAQYDNEDRERGHECEMVRFSFGQTGKTVKTKRFHWSVDPFPGFDMVVNEKGSLRSNRYYVTGLNNQLQFYFLMEALKKNDDTYFGVYLCVLGGNQTGVSVTTKCFLINHKNHHRKLPKVRGVRFPRKPGCRYLGCISKAEFIDVDYEQASYMGDGDLNLEFRVWGEFKTPQPTFKELKKFVEDGQVRDVILEVNDKKFTASKKLLMEQSPVFAKMLEKTKKNEKVKISDIRPNVMKQLLTYIHTGRATKLFKYSKELLAAADTYKLKKLKAICKSVID